MNGWLYHLEQFCWMCRCAFCTLEGWQALGVPASVQSTSAAYINVQTECIRRCIIAHCRWLRGGWYANLWVMCEKSWKNKWKRDFNGLLLARGWGSKADSWLVTFCEFKPFCYIWTYNNWQPQKGFYRPFYIHHCKKMTYPVRSMIRISKDDLE